MKQTKKKTLRRSSKRTSGSRYLGRKSYYFFAAALSLWLPKSYSAVLVDLDATALPEGPLATWANAGTVGGAFTAPEDGIPSVTTVQNAKGVTFDGTSNYYTGPAAPAEITSSGTRTVEAWILNPQVADEETIFSWGRRGGPDGSNASFNHGLNTVFGAVGHWGAGPDIGWNGQIASNRWTYVVYTYDGITTRVYMDGELANSEDMFLETWAFDDTELGNPLPFRIASQNEANGTPTAGLRGSMTIAKLRVHDVALDDATIQGNFEDEGVAFGLGDQDNDGIPTFYENQYSSFLDPTDASDAALDQDNDGLTNLQEFTHETIPDNPDTDGDTITDGAEVNRVVGGVPAATNPLRADTDGDGLADNVETGTGSFVDLTNTGTDPLLADTDNDTFPDLQEATLGSDPNSGASTPSETRGALISLDSSTLTPGVVNTWTNSGTLGGVFTGFGAPSASQVQGVNAISFNGTSQYYSGPETPSFITGNASRTIEAWILNPAAADEETIFSWGRRGGNPDGSNTSFNHGVHPDWGAVGMWGTPDIGWNGVENVKQGQWTYVVFTYDGPTMTTRLYSDGVEVNTEALANPLATFATDDQGRPLHFLVAAQNEANGTVTGGLRGSMSIAEIRVFDRVLDPSVISENFTAGQDKYGLIDYDNDLLPTWYERQFGFPERTANGTEDPDSDGLNNVAEFENGTNPTTADTDGDGINDGAEVNRVLGATNPLLADTDQDGLSDLVETADGSFNGPADTGTDPLLLDTDGDTFADGQEVFAGSDPVTLTSTPTFSADKPLIDLNPAALANGAVLSWTNSGSMGGSFTADANTAGLAETVSGAKAVSFGGTNYYNGPVTPVFITGNASRTVDAWLFNPAVDVEESVISWGRRGGPDGSNASYIHGTDATFGAMGQWGPGPDVGWGTNGPIAGTWTHVAYVYDGPSLTATVYRDGALANTEVMPTDLAIFSTNSVNAPLQFKLGAQNNADGSPGGQLASLSMGRVRVYDFALSEADVAAIYNAERTNYPTEPVGGADITTVALDQTTREISITWTPPAGQTVAVEASTNLTTWDAVATGLNTGEFSEPTTGANYKFYRLRVE